MFGSKQIAQEVGLISKTEKPVEKQAAVELNPVVSLIDDYLKQDTISNYLVSLEKTAGIDVPQDIKDLVAQAEERGDDELSVVGQIFEKKGYKLPDFPEEKHIEKDLLIKASAEITSLNDMCINLMDQFDLMKSAMDLVEVNQISPYKSYGELAEQTLELSKTASTENLMEAIRIKREELPGIGKAASRPSSNSKQSPEQRYLNTLLSSR